MCVLGAIYNLVLSRFADSRDSVLLNMASMPFGMHAVQKVRANMSLAANASNNGSGKWQKDNTSYKFTNADQYGDPSPSKYCDKMMNSIWGLYNRYSVHNFKSNTSSGQAPTFTQQQPATKESQDWLQKPIKCPLEGMKLNFNSKNFHQ